MFTEMEARKLGEKRDTICGLILLNEDYHKYSILWTDFQIIFSIDNIPIRVVKKSESMCGDYPSKPMSLHATIWNASGWATDGGKYRVNYKYAPFRAEFSDLVLHGCAVNPIEQAPKKCYKTEDSDYIPTGMTRLQRTRMASFRKRHMTCSYCYDRFRYKVAPPSVCSVPKKLKESVCLIRLRSDMDTVANENIATGAVAEQA